MIPTKRAICFSFMGLVFSMAILTDRSLRWVTESTRFNVKRCLDPVRTTIFPVGPIHPGVGKRQHHLIPMAGYTERLYLVAIPAVERPLSRLDGMDLIESSSMGLRFAIVTAMAFGTESLGMAILAICLIPFCLIRVLQDEHRVSV